MPHPNCTRCRVFGRMVSMKSVLFSFVVLSVGCLLHTSADQLAASWSCTVGTFSAFVVAAPDDHQSQGDVKFIGDYRRDLKAFLKRSKIKGDIDQQIGAIVDLCLLHRELVDDSRFEDNHQLQSFRAVAAQRLKTYRKQLELELKRYNRSIAKSKANKKPESDSEVNFSPGEADELAAQADRDYLHQAIVQDMQMITEISGGPVRLWSYTGGSHGPGICDYGPDLVRLIETTINSDFWRRNGGTGIIEYYQPLRILVVSASARVHDDMTDLLRTLRGTSR